MSKVQRSAIVTWSGTIARGSGLTSGGSGAVHNLPIPLASRTGEPEGKTSPEELIAAAHASGVDPGPSRERGGGSGDDPVSAPHRRVERLFIVRPQDEADREAAGNELEGLPGVVGVTLDHVTRAFDIIFDADIVSDDELAASLHHFGYDVIDWQEARAMHAAGQRTWLLEQIQSLAPRAELELAERGAYAEGATKGAVGAYLRVARAFGLMTDAEIRGLIPARFLEGPAPTEA